MKDELIKKLENDLKIRRYSDATIHRYCYITNKFLDYCEKENKSFLELNEYDAIEYLNHLTTVHCYKPSSYNNVNAIIKFFLEVTLEKDIGYKRLPNAKLDIKLKEIPTKEEIIEIIDATKNIKHKCWYMLAYGSGLRVSEIAHLKVKDIDSKNMKIKVDGKGAKQRLTVLPKTTLDLLRKYIINEAIFEKEEYLFQGYAKNHITESSISRSLKDVVSKLNMRDTITIHSFRRSFATHLLRMGVDIYEVKELMGHNSITTTSSYVKYVGADTKLKNPLDNEFYELHSSNGI